MKMHIWASMAVILLSCAAAQAQTTIYRETFGRPATDPQPDADGLGNITGNIFDWPTFRPTVAGGPALWQTMGSNASGVSGNAAAGQPIDVANINAGANSDGTTDAYARGLYFMAQQEQGPKLAWTPEFAFNPADYAGLTFAWRQGNDSDTTPFQLAVRIAGQWYVNNTQFFTVGYPDGVANFNASAQPQSFPWDATAANWATLDFDGTFNKDDNTGVDSTVPFATGAAPAADLSGVIDGFGLYSPSNVGTRRFDTFEILGTPVGGGKKGDFDTDNDVDGNDFLRWQRGQSPHPLTSTPDLADWKGNYAKATAAAAAVPEPAAVALVALSAAALLVSARRRADSACAAARRARSRIAA
jgi:hypothetical protein